MVIKKALRALSAVLCGLLLTACWDYVEINTMLIVSGIGLDIDGETYQATVEFVNVEAEGGENIAAETVTGEGNTIHAAIQNALLAAGGTMFANHCKAFVIGEELAKKGLGDIVEIVLRSPDFRKTVEIMIAKDAKASDIFAAKTVVNEIISYELANILKNNEKSVKDTVSTGSYELHEALLSESSYSVLPTVYVKGEGDDGILMVEGCAVVADGRLQGYMSGEECRLYQLITRKKQNIVLTLQDAHGKPVDVNIADSRVSLSPSIHGDEIAMQIRFRAKASLEEAVLSETNPMDSDARKQLEQSIGEQLSGKVQTLIGRIQARYGSDIFEFYEEYQDAYRQEWTDLRQDWPAHFRAIKVGFAADIQITGSGLIGDYSDQDGDHAVALP